MLNDSLARSSELFMYIAALIYTVVFIAFTSDVVANSRVTRRLEGRSEGTAQKPSVKAKIKVGAGAVSGASATANTAADTVRTGGTEQGTGERGMGYKGAAARALEGEVADSAMLYTGVRRPAARIAVVVMVLAALVHTAAVIMRGIAAQRVPWGNMYEFCTTGALMVSAVFLITLIFRDVRFVGTLVSGFVLIMLCAATIGFPTPVGHLKPALQSYWLVIHVSIAVLASGVFTITFAMAVLQLVQTRREQRILNGKSGGWALMCLVPERAGVCDVDVHACRWRYLGESRVGTLLGLGHQRGVDLRDLGGVCGVSARTRHPRLGRPPLGMAVYYRLCMHYL